MSKRKGKMHNVVPKQQDKIQTINMNAINRKKVYYAVGFKTGRHFLEKDCPRKKDWKREYIQ